MTTPQPERVTFDAAGAQLSALVWGDRDAPLLILLHGIRDCGHALDPVAALLAANYRVVVPDLRGHGESPHTGDYSLTFFMADLHATIAAFAAEHRAPHLVAHSLGGHIASNFAGLFPGLLATLTIIEGLGPPSGDHHAAFRDERARQLIMTAGKARPHRQMADHADAVTRLRRNNPRLGAAQALRLAEVSTRYLADDADGGDGLCWRFDPRVEEVWGTVDHDTSRKRWQAIQTPTLIITAALAMEYWRRRLPHEAADAPIPPYPAADLDDKIAQFPNASTIQIADAGHMVHYDQPRRLAAAIETFVASY